MSYSQFYDVNALEKVAINLFYGWGYNFYRIENQIRADDLMIRHRINFILDSCKSVIAAGETEYRKNNIKSPSRTNPFPSEDILNNVIEFESIIQGLVKLTGRLRSLPVPENDRMTQRYRQERQTLVQLVQTDTLMVGQAESLRISIDNKDADWILENKEFINAGIKAINDSIEQRQKLLQ